MNTCLPHQVIRNLVRRVRIVFFRCFRLNQNVQLHDPARVAFLNLQSGFARDDFVTPLVLHDRQRTIGQLITHQRVERQALDLLVVNEVVVVLSAELGQARDFNQLLDLSGAGLLFGLLLLLTVQLLVALDLLGLGFGRQALLSVIELDLAFMGQTLLLLLFFAGLFGQLLVNQSGFERLVA